MSRGPNVSSSGESITFAKIDANLEANPKIIKLYAVQDPSGFVAVSIYQYLLRRIAMMRVDGVLSADNADPDVIASAISVPKFGDSDPRVVTRNAVALLVTHRLIAFDTEANLVSICGWESIWGMSGTTNAERQAKYRAAKKDKNQQVESCDSDVVVTERNALQSVTTRNAKVPRGDESRGEEKKEKENAPLALVLDSDTKPRKRQRKKGGHGKSPEQVDLAMRVLAKLGERNSVRYSGADNHIKLISDRVEGGLTELELRAIVAYCAASESEGGLGWRGNSRMHKHLSPETLFGPETHTKYLDGARAWARSKGYMPAEVDRPRPDAPQPATPTEPVEHWREIEMPSGKIMRVPA